MTAYISTDNLWPFYLSAYIKLQIKFQQYQSASLVHVASRQLTWGLGHVLSPICDPEL